MAEIEVDTVALRGLTEELASLVEYCTALRAGAGGFAYMLPADWQGPALANFINTFEAWATSANAMTEYATGLRDHAAGVLSAYEGAISHADGTWQGVTTQLSSVGI